MARINRSLLIPLDVSSDQHIATRCTRRLHLLGNGEGEPDGLRKELLLQQLERLVGSMAVAVLAFAIMDNHVHLILRNDVPAARGWEAEEVVRRWLTLHPRRDGRNRPREASPEEMAELLADQDWLRDTRAKLCSHSEFMKDFKQRATEQINLLEGTTGAAWGTRFKSVQVKDVAQLVATMIYVDLNPFAAGLCDTPEAGRHTSLAGRLGRDRPAEAASTGSGETDRDSRPTRAASSAWLTPLDGDPVAAEGAPSASPRSAEDGARRRCVATGLTLGVYLRLVDAVSRRARDGKHSLSDAAESLLERLDASSAGFLDRLQHLATG